MRSVLFNQSSMQDSFQRHPQARFSEYEDPRGKRFAGPLSPEKSGPLPYASTPAAMEQVARAQMRDFDGAATGRGGRLLVAELTRDCVSITTQCDLEA